MPLPLCLILFLHVQVRSHEKKKRWEAAEVWCTLSTAGYARGCHLSAAASFGGGGGGCAMATMLASCGGARSSGVPGARATRFLKRAEQRRRPANRRRERLCSERSSSSGAQSGLHKGYVVPLLAIFFCSRHDEEHPSFPRARSSFAWLYIKTKHYYTKSLLWLFKNTISSGHKFQPPRLVSDINQDGNYLTKSIYRNS